MLRHPSRRIDMQSLTSTPGSTTPPRTASTSHADPPRASALSTPERKQNLARLLSEYLDMSQILTRNWFQALSIALDANNERNDRSASLQCFCTHAKWTELLNLLKAQSHSLPRTFSEILFDHTRKSLTLRPLKPLSTLLDEFDLASPKLGSQPASQCLERCLEYAFESGQSQDPSSPFSFVASSFSATRFRGPSLDLINVFLHVHNPLFPTEPSCHVDQPVSSSIATNFTKDTARIYYAKVLPLLQSSGFGKSRLCVQLSVLHPGMLVCMRDSPPQSQQVSFPSQDSHVFDFFVESHALLEQSSVKAHLHVLAWLALYCNTIAHYLSLLKDASNCFDDKHGCKPSDHQICWNTVIFYLATAIHSSPSSKFVPMSHFGSPESLCPRSKQTLERLVLSPPTHSMPESPKVFNLGDQAPADIRAARQHAPHILTTRFRTEMLKHISNHAQHYYAQLCEQCRPLLSRPECTMKAVHTFLRPSVLELEALTPKTVRPTFPFLAFDECGSIAALLPVIRRLWFRACPANTWILLIDTNSDLAPLAGKVVRKASRRMEEGGTHQLCESFSAMPTDINLTDQDRQEIGSLATCDHHLDLCHLDLLLPKLGRPLWNDALYHSEGYLQPRNMITKLVSPAGWEWPALTNVHDSPLDQNNQNFLALASQRIRIQLPASSGTNSFYSFVQEQISQHLRYISYISSTSETVITSTPSEPPLSVAAAWNFRCGTPTPIEKWGTVIQALVATRAPLGIDVGAQGEQGVMLLCTMAADIVARSMYKNLLDQSSMPYAAADNYHEAVVAPITVARWLETLIGNHHVEVPWPPPSSAGSDDKNDSRLSSTSAQADAKSSGTAEYRLWAERAWINFKHIVVLEKQVSQAREIDPTLLPELWLRHAAAQGPVNQPGWDLLIPVYHTPETDKPPMGHDRFDAQKLSYVAIQVKNCISIPDEVKKGPVGPRLSNLSQPTPCVELFIDLKGLRQHDGHQYSRRRFTFSEQAAGKDEAPEAQADRTSNKRPRNKASLGSCCPSLSPLCLQVRHHWYVKGSDEANFPLLSALPDQAKEPFWLLLGQFDSISSARFETAKARYIKHLSPAQQLAWHDNELRGKGKLVRFGPSTS
ncbi:uncharacterized protein UTRI_00932 [Ustilago trichophora]|uniref:Uncharacterized protein n=1 Tax=Ustilago trichophora TaxID=86804 RepID=A0A5C3DUU9_9BASI|nr:uncharacterized protein UTRI_00932 [Ustilago trichophora]